MSSPVVLTCGSFYLRNVSLKITDNAKVLGVGRDPLSVLFFLFSLFGCDYVLDLLDSSILLVLNCPSSCECVMPHEFALNYISLPKILLG